MPGEHAGLGVDAGLVDLPTRLAQRGRVALEKAGHLTRTLGPVRRPSPSVIGRGDPGQQLGGSAGERADQPGSQSHQERLGLQAVST